MAIQSKNSRAGKGAVDRNKIFNGGEENCLPKYNAANCGAHWKTSKKLQGNLNWGIKSKKRFGKEAGNVW